MARTLITNRDLDNDSASLIKVSGGILSTDGSSISANGPLSVGGDLSVDGNFSFTGTLTGGTVPWTRLSDVPDPVITISGDATGSATMTNLGNANISVTILNDSHTHDTRYYTETEADNRFVNVTGDILTGDLRMQFDGASASRALLFSGSALDQNNWALRAEGETLVFYEPEDTNKWHFKILDDTGVDAQFGYKVNGTTVVGSDAKIDWGVLKNYVSVTAGNGLTGGGNLTDNRTITLGTPGTLSSSTTNAVTTSSHTHAIDTFDVSGTTNQITVTGAGKVLGAGITLSLPQNIHTGATPTFSQLTLSSAGSDTSHAVRADRTITAGNGLTGGGNLTDNRTITLGTPGTLTSSTTNSVTSDSHTHAITNYAISGTSNQITVTGAGRVLGAAVTLSLPQNIHTSATPTFARLHLGSSVTNVASPATGDIITGNASGTFQYDASALTQYFVRATNNSTPAQIFVRKSRGTAAEPLAIVSGDDILSLGGYGYDGEGWRESSRILLDTEGTIVSGAAVPGIIRFYTSDAAGTVTQRMFIDSTGQVQIVTPSGLDGATPPTLTIHSTNSGTWVDESIAAQLLFSTGDSSGGAGPRGGIKLYMDNTAGNDAGLSFWTTTGGANDIKEQMRIDHAGNVGIGIIPTSKLHVDGTANITGALTLGTQATGTTHAVRADRSISAGDGLTGGGNLTADRTISHADTSTQASVNNSNGTVIQSVTLDTYGHVTNLTSVDLDARFVNNTGDTINGLLHIIQSTSGAYALKLENTNDTGGNLLLLESYGDNADDILIKAIRDTNGTPVDAFTLDGSGNLWFSGTLQQGTIPWARISNVPDPVITLGGDLSGSVTLTNLGSGTLNATVADDSHSHSNSTISSLDWSKLLNVPDPVITLSGDITGSGTMTNLGNVTINATVANDSHTHDGRYYTESEADSRFLNLGGGTMTGMLTANGGITVDGDDGILITEGAAGQHGWKIIRSGETLRFIEPEDSDKLHFEINDDTGVNAPYGYWVGSNQVADSSGQVVGKIVSPNVKATTASIAPGNTSYTWTHNYGSTNYAVSVLTDSAQRHTYFQNKTSNSIEIYLDDESDVTINLQLTLIGW